MVLRMLYYDEAANTWLSTLTDLLEDIGLMDPFDIDPGNGRFVFERKTGLNGADFLLGELRFVVVDYAYLRLLYALPADMHQ